MYPYIYMLGKQFPSYALLALLGVGAAFGLGHWNAKRSNQSCEDVFYAGLFGCIGAMAGGKLMYLITVMPALVRSWNDLMQAAAPIETLYSLLTGGFVFYGGLFGAMAGVYFYARKYHLSFRQLLDVFAPSVALFHVFGRFGCLLAGCCYGIPYIGICAVEIAGQSRFPIQIVEAIFNLLLLMVLMLYFKAEHKSGRVMALYLIMYGAARFLMEYLRGDEARGFWFGFSTSQYLSIVVAGMACLLWFTGDFQNKCRNKEKS